MKQGNYILGIGAINIDICGASNEKVLLRDSNPGRVTYSFGGVTRNILENICRLGTDVKMISVVGNDNYGKEAIEYLREIGFDVDYIKMIDEKTSTYISILDENNDMYVGLSDMKIVDSIEVEDIKKHREIIEEASIIVTDTVLKPEVLEYISQEFSHKKIYLDPVSIGKIKRNFDLIDKFYGIKFNEYEAKFYTGLEEPKQMANYFYDEGIKEVVITFGSKGVYIKNDRYDEFIEVSKLKDAKNASGAGDSYMGAMLYALNKGLDFKEANIYGMASARICLKYDGTINPDLSIDLLKRELEGEML